MDSTRPLKVCCGILHQDVDIRSLSPVSCKMGPPWIRLVCPAHPQMLDWIEIWEIWRPIQQLKLVVVLLKPFLNHFCFVEWCIILLNEAIAIREYFFHERVYMVCNNAKVGGMCQSYIHMNGRTQSFPPQHCPKHYTASTTLPSSHNASRCPVFPR